MRRPALALSLLLAFLALAAPPRAADDGRELRRDAVVRAVEKVGPAVVNISTEILVRNPYAGYTSPFEWFFGHPRPPRHFVENSLGSGVIVDPEGYVLTNNHVIEAASRITVTLQDGRQVRAKLVGSDRDSDLAVLKLDEDGPWPYVRMGRSDDLMIGEKVIAIGNPFGLQNTVTVGVVSALGRTLPSNPEGDVAYADFIQTDAAINPGNSGGALVNVLGELVGINSQVLARGQNLGFAIPIDRARKVFRELVRYGKVLPAWTGLVVEEITKKEARQLGLGDVEGLLVVRRFADSPAEEAGIGVPDVIVAVGGHPVKTLPDWTTALARVAPGQKVEVEFVREGAKHRTWLEVRRFPEDRAPTFAWKLLGFTVTDTRAGATIDRVRRDSWLGRRGLRPGAVVVELDGEPIRSAREFYERIPQVIYRRAASLSIRVGGSYYRITVPLR